MPDEWPELLGGLVDVISAARDGALVAGAVRCLSLFVDDLGEKQVHQVPLPPPPPPPPPGLAGTRARWHKAGVQHYLVTWLAACRRACSVKALSAAAHGARAHLELQPRHRTCFRRK